MEERSKATGVVRILWSSVLGFGLIFALLWALMPYTAAKAQDVNAGFTVPVPSGGSRELSASRWVGSGASPFASADDGARIRSPKARLLTPPMPGSADLAICMSTDRVWGVIGAGETATVTVNGMQMGAARADDIGFFWTTLYDANGNRPGLSDGDAVAIYRDGIQETSVTLRAITGTVDVVNNVVAGAVGDVTSPISVTVYRSRYEWDAPSFASISQTVSSDSLGNFTVLFGGVWDFFADDRVVVSYVENGVGVHRYIYADRMAVLPTPSNNVLGWTTPGVGLTVTVFLSDATTIKAQAISSADQDTGRYSISSDDLGDEIQESDIVVVEVEGGTVMSRIVDALDFGIDTTGDRVIGQTEPLVTVRGYADNLTPLGWRSVYTTSLADPTGAFTLEFGAIADLMPGQWVGVYVPDADGDDLVQWFPSPSVEVNQTWNEVTGNGPSPIGPLSEGRIVTLTLYSAVSDTTFVYSTTLNTWSQYEFLEEKDGLPDIAPGDVVTVESEGYAWQGVVHVQTMIVDYDLDADQFTGSVELPTGRVEVSGEYYQGELYPLGASFDALVTATGPFVAAPVGFDVNHSLPYEVVHRAADDYVERISRETDTFGVSISGNRVEGTLNPPDTPFTITLRDSGGGVKAQMTGTSREPVGRIGWPDFWWSNERIEAGDRVQMQSAAGFSQTVIIPDLGALPDLDADIVAGQGPPNSRLQVYVDNQGYGSVPTDDGGQFVVAVDQLQEMSGDGDLVWGDNIYVETIDEHRTWVYDRFAWPLIIAHYDMEGGNNIWGEYAIEGNAVNVIVTHPISGDIATGTAIPGACSWCRPDQYELNLPANTLIPGVTVTVDFGDGFVDSVTVLDIGAEVNVDTDVVTVTAPVSTPVFMNADGPGGWWDSDERIIGGSGTVTFDLGADGYDVVPGTGFNVHSRQYHDHNTQYSFWLAAPDVRVSKWHPAGYARPGGVVVYAIYYRNDGNGVAEGVQIVDTLPVSTTYAGDTSGVMPTVGGGVVTWDLGDLAPGDEGAFMVTLDVPGTMPTGGGGITPNCALITTATPGDNPDNNEACAGPVDVWEDDVEIQVDKWVFPGDPTPGQEFVYTVQWCNNRGAAVGPVWLTDTLPVSTTFVSWSAQNWWEPFWTEVSASDDQLALYAPGLSGDRCLELYITLLLDAGVPISTTLENEVVIAVADDVYWDNNYRYNADAHVSPPRYDLRLEKSFNSGVLVPGGWINYFVQYYNDGNMATHVELQDTLPNGVSYDYAYWGGDQPNANEPLPAPLIAGNDLTWDLGVIPVSGSRWFHIQANIDGAMSPGTTIANCATVDTPDGNEDYPGDNSACYTDTVNDLGPNLRVTKSHWWDGDGQLDYDVRFENIGDQTVSDVWISDYLPAGTTWNGWWNIDPGWDERLVTYTESSNFLAWNLSELNPGDVGGVHFEADLDEPGVLMQVFTNTAEISTPPGDPTPLDNHYDDEAFSGMAQLMVWINDPDGNPANGHVGIWDEWGGFITARGARPDRPAMFADLEVGASYWVQAFPLSAERPAWANSVRSLVPIGDELVEFTLALQHPNITGVIRTPEGDPLPPVYDGEGNPTYPAVAHIHNGDWSVDLRVATNITGEFGMAMPDDVYVLRGEPAQGLVFTYTKSLSHEVAPPQDLGEVRLTYPRVWGAVVTPRGDRVSTWVSLWREDGEYWDGDDTFGPPDDEEPFRLGGMPAGYYFVQAEPPWTNPEGYGFSDVYGFDVEPDSWYDPASTEQITLTLQPANFVGDVLFPPSSDCPDCPVRWVDARVHDRYWTFENWATTGEDGRFAFSGLDPGVYTVEVFLKDYLLVDWAPPDLVTFTVTSPDERDMRTLYLQPAPRNKYVYGQVVYEDGSPVLDDDGDGLGDARVYAYREGSAQSADITTDPTDGSYELALTGGRWRLGVEKTQPNVDWYFDPGLERTVEFTLPAAIMETRQVTLTVIQADHFHVTGRVEDPNGDPPPEDSVWIHLCLEGSCFSAPVAPDGNFSVSALPGVYRVWVWVEPGTGFAPPSDNGRFIFVDEDPEDIGTFQLRTRSTWVSGRVIIASTGQGLTGVKMEGWTDDGDSASVQTGADGFYTLNLVPGRWHAKPVLSSAQEENYVVWPPQQRSGSLKAGETISNVNFLLRARDATIRGRVVDEVGNTLTDVGAVIFAQQCTNACWVVDEAEVQGGTFQLRVVGGLTYSVGIWLPTGGYIPGPDVPVDVFVDVWGTKTEVLIELLEAGTRIWGELHDGETGELVHIEASVYGSDSAGHWVEDTLWPDKSPYQYNLYVITPETDNITWTLGLGVDPSTGYIADPARPRYEVMVEISRTMVWEPLLVKKLDTVITGTVSASDIPIPYIWVFAEGKAGTASAGLRFEAETNKDGKFSMYVLPGEYLVGAYLPPHLTGDYYPPTAREWRSTADNPIDLAFRLRAGLEVEISGSLSVSPTGSLDGSTPIQVFGWSEDGDVSEVAGSLDSGYILPASSDATWHVWAAYEDPVSNKFYLSQEEVVNIGNANATGVDLLLEYAGELPDTECWTFAPSQFKRLSLPAWGSLPEPLVEIQAGTMPVAGTVKVCATPKVAVPGFRRFIGFVYELEARDQTGNLITGKFNKPVRLIFYLVPEAIPSGAEVEDLDVVYYSTVRQEWVSLDDVFIDPEDLFATGKIDHFSRFGIRAVTPGVGGEIYLPLLLRNFGS